MADPQLEQVDHDPWANADREPFGGVDPSQIALAPSSAAGTVGPNAANAVGRAVGGAAVAPLWDAGQYVGGLLHGNEQWDSSKAVQLAGGLGAMFFPFGRGGAAAKGAADVIESAAPTIAKDAVKGIDVYHGSPHDFDRFDLSKIGTGEGAQAYGHGLYFAEAEPTAQSYKIGEQPDPTPDWLHDRIATRADEIMRNAYPDLTNTAKGRGSRSPEYLDAYDRAVAQASSEFEIPEPAAPPPGHMYQARINADPEHFLDWDKPLSKQTETVKRAVSKVYGIPFDKMHDQVFARQVSPEQSVALAAEGVPGIRYADQGSRQYEAIPHGSIQYDPVSSKYALFDEWGAVVDRFDDLQAAKDAKAGKLPAKQTRNYVVFDDKLIDILKKYGLAGLISGGGYSLGGGHGHVIPAKQNPFDTQ